MRDEMQHAVITGGSGSLGQAVALVLQSPDYTVASPGRDELDMRDEAAIRRYFHQRPVDLLVCAAGIIRDAPLLRLTGDAWDATLEVNYKGAAACADAVLPWMLGRKQGHIVFISSYSALHPPVGQAAYAAAKAALLGLVNDLARRHGPSNIRVNAILPGFLETRMTAAVSPSRKAEVLSDHVLGRFNTCEHVAEFIRFLHDSLPHTSGQVFQLDSRPDARGLV